MADGVALPFDREEYDARLAKVRAAMEHADLDGLVVADPSNIAWLTGYDGWSFYTPQAVFVSHDDDPLWWGRGIDLNGARMTTWMDDDHLVGYSDHFVQTPDRHPLDHLGTTLTDRQIVGRGIDPRRIGVELDNYYYSAAGHRALSSALGVGETVFADATALVNWQRAVKSERELSYMRIAGEIVELAFAAARDTIRPGIRKSDLVAEIYRAAIRGTEEHGGDYPAIVPLVPSGIETSTAHLTWNDNLLEPDTGTFFELAGCYRRYHVPLCRTAFLGTPPANYLRAAAALDDGIAAGIDAARAGNQAGDVARALNATVGQHGFDRGDKRCGYPIGLSYPPDWGERTISFRPSDETVLEAGMTFHFMPALWQDDWGFELTESIVITADGPAARLADVSTEIMVGTTVCERTPSPTDAPIRPAGAALAAPIPNLDEPGHATY